MRSTPPPQNRRRAGAIQHVLKEETDREGTARTSLLRCRLWCGDAGPRAPLTPLEAATMPGVMLLAGMLTGGLLGGWRFGKLATSPDE